MSQSYTINIRNLYDQEDRAIVIDSPNPMVAHKEAYMKTNTNEEIVGILDSDGQQVYDLAKGFAITN
jgi:hypothetical protein